MATGAMTARILTRVCRRVNCSRNCDLRLLGIYKIRLLDAIMGMWRMAGLNYVTYSKVAARTLRKALKPNLREEAARQDQSSVKYFYWTSGNQLAAGETPKVPLGEKR